MGTQRSLMQTFALISLILTSSLRATPDSGYEDLARENLKSITTITPKNHDSDETEKHSKKRSMFFHEFLRNVLAEQFDPPLEIKRRAVFTILAQHDTRKHMTTPCLDKKSWQDLELACGSKSRPDVYLAKTVDRTSTEAGRLMLYRSIIDPTAHIATLRKRQSIVRELAEHDALFEQLDKNITQLRDAEAMVLSIWDPHEPFRGNLQRSLIHLAFERNVPAFESISTALNKNEYALEVNEKLDLAGFTLKALLAASSIITLPLYGLALMANHPKTKTLERFNNTIGSSNLSSLLSLFSVAGVAANVLIWTLGKNRWSVGTSHLISGYQSLGFSWWNHIQATDKEVFISALHIKLKHITRYVENLATIACIIQTHAHTDGLQHLAHKIKAVFERAKKSSEEAKKLLSLLATYNFKKRPTFLSHKGTLFATYNLLETCKEQFAQLMVLVGEVDMYLSSARLIREMEQSKAAFCFPTYQENTTTPQLHAQEFWNPIVGRDKVVTNNIALGNTHRVPRNMIITGPNAGGKSTIMKGLLYNIILAQSIGVAPAKNLIFTPFTTITTYLNITDDAAIGHSLFKAEVLRAKQLLEAAKQSGSKAFALTALDEVFNATSYHEGEACAHTLLKTLGGYSHTMCIANTHFAQLPKLEEETGNFINYKVMVREASQTRSPARSYKLTRGISDQIITLSMLRDEGFDKAFIEATQQRINTP